MSHRLSHADSRRGGQARTAAKRAALARLHRVRRGRRQNRPGLNERQLGILLADVAAATRPARPPHSVRSLALALRVSDRTVRRWLAGTDWPPATRVRALQSWLRSQTET